MKLGLLPGKFSGRYAIDMDLVREAEDLGFNKVVTVSKDPYKQVFGYEYYTEKAMNFFYELQSRKAAIKVNEACYFAVTMIPLKKYYKELLILYRIYMYT